MPRNGRALILKEVSVLVDDYKNTRLHYSAASGNVEEVFKDLNTESKIDAENYVGWTPLMMACRNGHFQVVEILLKHLANASKKNGYGYSVLTLSICSKNLKLVHLILEHLLTGGISRQSLERLFPPLAMSILFYNEEVLSHLIRRNFNVNCATRETGLTPLMFAGAMDNFQAIILLLSQGANKQIRNRIGCSALTIQKYKRPNLSQICPDMLLVSEFQKNSMLHDV